MTPVTPHRNVLSALTGSLAAVETHLQQKTAGPTEATRALTKRLADLAKNDGPRFAEVVRQADAAQAAGISRDEAYRLAFQRTGPGPDSGSLPP